MTPKPQAAQAAAGQATPAYRAPRTADGKPNLNGIWQALNEANWDLEPHAAYQGSLPATGAQFSVPPGIGVVDGGTIPYKPEALAQKKENFANRAKLDPEVKCYMGGVPRSTYMPYPFQVIQGTGTMMITYEFAGAVRIINMGKPTESPTDSWMGWSNGHWEGDTLVIDVTGFNDLTWFDRAGDYHSDMLHVVERYTPRSADTLMYEATIEDPKTFSRPWKISMPLYRRVEKNAQVMEYKCPEFAEEVIYGHLRKQTSK
ncbi:MAG TPA: hypothetical protein VGK48_20555 [Terriglobia bacterium]